MDSKEMLQASNKIRDKTEKETNAEIAHLSKYVHNKDYTELYINSGPELSRFIQFLL